MEAREEADGGPPHVRVDREGRRRGERRDPPRLGEAAATTDVGLHDVHRAARAELAEAPARVLGLAACDRDPERRLDLAVPVHVLGDDGLLEPGEVTRFELTAEAD